ncbi:guanylate kinase [Hyphomicrobium nitrativorans NL23]|uniref:Guanylate kinase n=1 Tax=Hyphomicrobium nitrativorans NL23 TaxID=1029756 RepID=V5SFQ1_9HYPH|nr:guanylate kinase [Hyphomicrobium nitrativorans]AHB48855.1 guanylate kinase [Hyphomicrobium nitrativorans NL23]
MTSEQPRIERRGLLLVLSSPSGAGKTSLARALLDTDPDIRLSVSATTRKPRPGEVDGEDYWFVDEAKFKAMIEADEFLEWATVFGNYYGTPRAPIEAAVSKGRDVLFDIDWQGTQQLAERMAGELVRVFVLPPSGEALEARLKRRAQDPDHVVAKRMAGAAAEISHWAEYDYVIVNGDLGESIAGLKAILAAERHKRERMTGLTAFVRDLQAALT